MTNPIDFRTLHKTATTVIEGDFNLVIVDATVTETQNGKPMIKAKLQVEDGPYAGRPLYKNFTLSAESPGALKIWFKEMAVLGMGEAFFSSNPVMETIAQNMIGQRVLGEVGKRTWQGIESEDLKTIKPPQALGMPSAGSVAANTPTITVPNMGLGGTPTISPERADVPTQPAGLPIPPMTPVPTTPHTPGPPPPEPAF